MTDELTERVARAISDAMGLPDAESGVEFFRDAAAAAIAAVREAEAYELHRLRAALARTEANRDTAMQDAAEEHKRAERFRAENEILKVRASIARWSVEEDGSIVRVCRGEHEKGEPCQEERFVLETELDAAVRADLENRRRAVTEALCARNRKLGFQREDFCDGGMVRCGSCQFTVDAIFNAIRERGK